MKTHLLKYICLIIVGLTFSVNIVQAATYYWAGGTNSNWNNPNNWYNISIFSLGTGNGFPVASDIVFIGVDQLVLGFIPTNRFTGASHPTVNTTSACASLTMGTDELATLTMSSPLTVSVSGAITIGGNSTITGAALLTGSSFTVAPAVTATLNAPLTCTGGAVTLGASSVLTTNNAGVINAATLTATSSTFNIGASATFTGAITISGNTTTTGVATLTGTGLSLNAGTFTSGATMQINGAATITGNRTISLSKPITITGNFAPSYGASLTVSGSSTLAINGELNLTGAAGTIGTVNAGATINAGTLTLGNAVALTNSGTITSAGIVTLGGSNTLNNSTATSSFTVLAGGMNLPNASVITNSGIFKSVGNITSGGFTITNSKTFDIVSCAVLLSNNNDKITNNLGGIFTISNSTMNFNGGTCGILNSGTFNMGLTAAPTTFNIGNNGAYITNNSTGTFNLGPNSIISFKFNDGTINTKSSSVTNLGTFTIQSDATGSGTIAQNNGAALSGNYKVERYFTGNSANSRGYRLVSSPVSVSSSSLILPNLTYIKTNAYTTGTSGATNGFDASGNPTLYFYRENMAPNFTSFLSGNFRGVKTINTTSSFTIDNDPGSFTLPAGNGFLFFFRGDKSTTSNPTVTSTIAKPTTFTASGYLNQGTITVKHWTTGSAGLLYTNSTILNSTVRGYNLVGNPYASSIDWDKFGTEITGTNIDDEIRVYNPILKVYASYIKGDGGAGTNYNGPSGTANIIPSGQGFFVKANSTSPTLVFKETAKVNTQASSATLLMSTGGGIDIAKPVPYIRLLLFKDSLNKEDALIFFKETANSKYVKNEDAEYWAGNSIVNISTVSSDNKKLAINKISFPKKNQVIIPVNANITSTGLYTLTLSEIKNIPPLYEIYLMDAYKKDSLDVLTNSTYNFNAVYGDTATYGNSRFKLVIRQKTSMILRLLDFSAGKTTTGVQLSWITENESNYTNFTVERSVDNGKTFEVIGGIASSDLGKYSLLDKAPVIGLNQYRLKQDDINGAITYSKVVNLMYSNTNNNVAVNNVSVYPNPVTTMVNVDIVPQVNTTAYNIRITNGVGTLVKAATSSQPTWQGNVSNLLPGTYFVQVINNNTKAIIGNNKFIKN